jgi:hypothetical protein
MSADDSAATVEQDIARRNGEGIRPETDSIHARDKGVGDTAPPGSEKDPTTDEQEGPSSLERAEELADQIGARIGFIASVVGRQVIRLAALTREAAEDFWAEAQDIRHGKQDEPPADEPEVPAS